jgi:hypothetical protein
MVVFGIIAVSVAAGLFLALRSEPESHAAPTSPAPAAVAATTTAPAPEPTAPAAPAADVVAPARETVRIHIEVSPANALVTLDGSLLPKLPFTADLVKDGTMHHIQASLAGYETQKIMLPFDAPREMRIVLDEKSARPRKRPSSSVAAAPTPPEPAAPVAAPEPKKPTGDMAPGADLNSSKPRVRTGIDVNDPYAN